MTLRMDGRTDGRTGCNNRPAFFFEKRGDNDSFKISAFQGR